MLNLRVPCTRWPLLRDGVIFNKVLFKTVIGHLYAGARAYPYVLTQRCNDISFSQVPDTLLKKMPPWLLAHFLLHRFLGEKTLEWQPQMNCRVSSGDIWLNLHLFCRIFLLKGMPLWKLLFLKSRPLSGGVVIFPCCLRLCPRENLSAIQQNCFGKSLLQSWLSLKKKTKQLWFNI